MYRSRNHRLDIMKIDNILDLTLLTAHCLIIVCKLHKCI